MLAALQCPNKWDDPKKPGIQVAQTEWYNREQFNFWCCDSYYYYYDYLEGTNMIIIELDLVNIVLLLT